MCNKVYMNIEEIRCIQLVEKDVLKIDFANNVVMEKVRPRRLFPLTYKDKYILFIDSKGEEVGIILDIKELDGGSNKNIRTLLDRFYLFPEILEIISIKETLGVISWYVKTDKGYKEFEILDTTTDVKRLGAKHLVIVDIDDNRYEIKDYEKLNPTSRNMLEEQL